MTGKTKAAPEKAARRGPWLIVALLVAALAVAGWLILKPGAPESGARWNVLLVSLDTTRPDRLEACGGAAVPTPALDRVRAGGTLFSEMVTTAPVTLPAHASLFTAQNPYRHGLRENTEYALATGAPTLAGLLRADGYTTAAFIGSYVLDRGFGLAQGFEYYADDLTGPEPGLSPYQVELPGELVGRRAAAWLDQYATRRRAGVDQRPFFLFVHFYDAHAPYVPPAPYDSLYAGRLYEGELAYQDHSLGLVLDALEASGEAPRTLIWVVSDHGESLGDHLEMTHGLFIYDATLRVVSILKLPGGSSDRVVADPTSLADVGPTLLELLGIDSRLPEADGRSLAPLLRGRADPERVIYCETLSPYVSYHWSPLFGVRSAEWKYIRAPVSELYNLRRDPHETENVIARFPQEAHTLEAELDGFLAEEGPAPGTERALAPEERERLRSLGYVAAEPAAGEPQGELPDPKEKATLVFGAFQEAKALIYAGRLDEAAEAYRRALRLDPLNNSLHLNLAAALRLAGRHAEASRSYREAIRLEPRSPRGWEGWGKSLLALGRADSAAWAFEHAVAQVPSPERWIELARARAHLGRPAQAAAALDSALARGGDPVLLHGLLARVLAEAPGAAERARYHLQAFADLIHLPPAQARRRLPPLE